MLTVHTLNEGSDEDKYAKILAKIAIEGCPSIQTDKQVKLDIVPNILLYGDTTKDIDILVIYRSKQQRFIATVELKLHSPAKIKIRNNNCFVAYRNFDGEENLHNVTLQSSKQVFILKNYITRDLGSRVNWIESAIWLANMPKSALIEAQEPSERKKSPLFPADFTWDEFLKKMQTMSNNPFPSAPINEEMVERLLKAVGNVVEFSDLDKSRYRKLTSTALDNNRAQYMGKLGEQILIFQGKGGTGKTARLVRLAHQIFKKHNGRVLFLTYNLSLRSDVQRIFNWLAVPNPTGGAGVYPDSVYSFMVAWFEVFKIYIEELKDQQRLQAPLLEIHRKWFEIDNSVIKGDINFFDTFKPKQRLLLDALKSGAIDKSFLRVLKNRGSKRLDWDFIMVDEAQDWPEEERDFLFAFYGPTKIILADGEDQLVRSQVKTEWSTNSVSKQIITLRKSLRLKSSLCDITNNIAKALNYNWSLEKDTEVHGGRVVLVYGDPLSDKFYRRISSTIEQYNLSPIDVLSIVPPSMVVKTQKSENPHVNNIKRKDSRVEKYSLVAKQCEKHGEVTWDATSDDVRKETPTSKFQFRFVPYESCRGLEGWIAVNYALDEFFDSKISEYRSDKVHPGEIVFDEHKMAMEYATKWLMIPLTRAVDTLIIHIQNRESILGQVLETMQKDNPSLITVEHI